MSIKWQIEKRNIDDLKGYEKNPRKFTDKGLKDLKKSLENCGDANIITINKDNTVLGGHARLTVMKQLGYKEVDVKVPDRLLNDKECQEIVIRLNANTAGEWDFEKLEADFDTEELEDWGLDVDFAIEEEEKEVIEDEVPEEVETRCKLGDIWQLGEHRLMCGDSTKVDDVEKLMNGEKADMVFTDPPYGCNYQGGLNEKKKQQIKNDNLIGQKLYEFLYDIYKNIKLYTNIKSAIYVFYTHANTKEFINALWDAGLKQRSIIAWYKTSGGFGDFMSQYMNAYEPCIYASNGDSVNWYGANNEKTVWEIDKERECKLHPTMKPIAVVSRAIKNSSQKNNKVLDLFGGSGSTLIACEQLNRKCYTMELDEHYCDVIITRWENLTGKEAELING